MDILNQTLRKTEEDFHWSPTEVRLLSSTACPRCAGGGYANDAEICHCVFRRIFETCHRRYEQTASMATGVLVTGITCSRPAEEYAADFVLVGRRALQQRPLLLAVFNLYIVDGLPTQMCLRKLKIAQNVFFRRVFQIKQELGRAFREVRPYPLYPINEYNGSPSLYSTLNFDRVDDDADEGGDDDFADVRYSATPLHMPDRVVTCNQEREAA